MDGDGFDVKVVKKQEVFAGEVLVEVDLAKIEQAGYATTTLMTVTNTKAMRAVTPLVGSTVEACAPVIDIQR